jgi:NAD-dependent deacetylase
MAMSVEDLIKRAALDLAQSSYAIALTGAGISTESGIPDFRSPSGGWKTHPEMEKLAYQNYDLFLTNPLKWWEEWLEIESYLDYLEKVAPNPGHYALAILEQMGILKCLITQNIDNLHRKAGSTNIIEYHGNAFRVRCNSCGQVYQRDDFDIEKLIKEEHRPPVCPRCGGMIKSDIVSFGEPIPQAVVYEGLSQVSRCDLMLVCGTSAVVYPFAGLPRLARKQSSEMIIIEINNEPTPLTDEGISDYLIKGKTGEILPHIVKEVGHY